ncbi:hypothetical protein [Brumimicrobium mesophilum]|uniref:hypothetical protein n=1 Tax=Brumimicrobium mesophilum TaxID=392717 RepID=UPI000D141476|nr:hypothetical protein [Brumimicrobium mesophilum]
MKLFLGYIFALFFVISSGVSEYSKNQLVNQVDTNLQLDSNSNKLDASFSPYHKYVHHNLGVDFQEKNEKFKKFIIFTKSTAVNFSSFPKNVDKFDSTYFSKFIIPSVSKHILLETFRI